MLSAPRAGSRPLGPRSYIHRIRDLLSFAEEGRSVRVQYSWNAVGEKLKAKVSVGAVAGAVPVCCRELVKRSLLPLVTLTVIVTALV